MSAGERVELSDLVKMAQGVGNRIEVGRACFIQKTRSLTLFHLLLLGHHQKSTWGELPLATHSLPGRALEGKKKDRRGLRGGLFLEGSSDLGCEGGI